MFALQQWNDNAIAEFIWYKWMSSDSNEQLSPIMLITQVSTILQFMAYTWHIKYCLKCEAIYQQTSVAWKCALSLIPVGLAAHPTTTDIQRCQDDSTQRCYYNWTTCTAHQPLVSTSCRLHRCQWLEWCVITTPLPLSYIGSCTDCQLVNDWLKSWRLSHTRCDPLAYLVTFHLGLPTSVHIAVIWQIITVCTVDGVSVVSKSLQH